MIDWNTLFERVNGDPEFRLASRHWNAILRLDMGDASHALRFEGGALTEVAPSRADAPADVFIGAPEATWDQMLAPVPRPFYQDLTGAALHHGVQLPPDATAYAAYYPALRRLMQLLGAARREALR